MSVKAPRAAHRILKADPVLARVIEAAGPFTLTPLPERSPFEALARAIAHQQLHAKAAESILARFVALHGSGAFPQPQQVLQTEGERLRGCGLSYSKIAALKDLAQKTVDGVVPSAEALATLADDAIIERLTQVRGIGRWTVEMLLMFQLARLDVLPVDDFGVRNGFRLAYRLSGMPTPKALAEFGERWKPYRSLAAWYLWRAVELDRNGTLPRCPRPPRVALQKPPKKRRALKAKTRRGRGARKTVSKRKAAPRRQQSRGRGRGVRT